MTFEREYGLLVACGDLPRLVEEPEVLHAAYEVPGILPLDPAPVRDHVVADGQLPHLDLAAGHPQVVHDVWSCRGLVAVHAHLQAVSHGSLSHHLCAIRPSSAPRRPSAS